MILKNKSAQTFNVVFLEEDSVCSMLYEFDNAFHSTANRNLAHSHRLQNRQRTSFGVRRQQYKLAALQQREYSRPLLRAQEGHSVGQPEIDDEAFQALFQRSRSSD